MHFLQSHHIMDLYCLVDDLVEQPPKPRGGRPPALKVSETVTILLWSSLVARQQTLKDIYQWAVL